MAVQPCLSEFQERPFVDADRIAAAAVRALHEEAMLTPKPGLVDQRGSGAHDDMDVDLLLRSAEALRESLTACASAAMAWPLGRELRGALGVVGRAGERAMLSATGGVNTHRGALWALGLLAAGAALRAGATEIAQAAGELARLPDLRAAGDCPPSHGERARCRYGSLGARGEAGAGFPHVLTIGLPTLRAAREQGGSELHARLDALLAIMASLDDTCVLHRGGAAGLALVQREAGAVLAAGGAGTARGRARIDRLDEMMSRARLSPGGSGDLLAATLFLDALDEGGGGA
jgi:triphosphoribosyl-dephospho-CoA synthase